ncbi:MAG: hypothetical protein PHS93_03745 [Candidatus Omnitrophica bacterium]|nr:hypothetical protein [Candidatus Omnitrophota bacterium]MDD5352265.1 hypothetical protein [Candidatus Omnitrophota bacterium]MDD5549863.1 hypothetical protein [Candidatus Omnitrophota bacterium]
MLKFKRNMIAVVAFCISFLLGNLGFSIAQANNDKVSGDESEITEQKQSDENQKEPEVKKKKKRKKSRKSRKNKSKKAAEKVEESKQE